MQSCTSGQCEVLQLFLPSSRPSLRGVAYARATFSRASLGVKAWTFAPIDTKVHRTSLATMPNLPGQQVIAGGQAGAPKCWDILRRHGNFLATFQLSTHQISSPWIAGDWPLSMSPSNGTATKHDTEEGECKDNLLNPLRSPVRERACSLKRSMRSTHPGFPASKAATHDKLLTTYSVYSVLTFRKGSSSTRAFSCMIVIVIWQSCPAHCEFGSWVFALKPLAL